MPTHKYGRRQFKLPILFYFSNFAIQHFNLFHSPSMRRNDTNNKFLLSVMKCFSKKQRLTTTRMVSISLDKDYWRKLTIFCQNQMNLGLWTSFPGSLGRFGGNRRRRTSIIRTGGGGGHLPLAFLDSLLLPEHRGIEPRGLRSIPQGPIRQVLLPRSTRQTSPPPCPPRWRWSSRSAPAPVCFPSGPVHGTWR